jgi:hypothetical protein
MKRFKNYLFIAISIVMLVSLAITTSHAQWWKPKECLYSKYMADAIAYGAQLQLSNGSISESTFSTRMQDRLAQVKKDHSRYCKTSTHVEVPVIVNEVCTSSTAKADVVSCAARTAQRNDFLKPRSLYWQLVMDPLN